MINNYVRTREFVEMKYLAIDTGYYSTIEFYLSLSEKCVSLHRQELRESAPIENFW